MRFFFCFGRQKPEAAAHSAGRLSQHGISKSVDDPNRSGDYAAVAALSKLESTVVEKRIATTDNEAIRDGKSFKADSHVSDGALFQSSTFHPGFSSNANTRHNAQSVSGQFTFASPIPQSIPPNEATRFQVSSGQSDFRFVYPVPVTQGQALDGRLASTLPYPNGTIEYDQSRGEPRPDQRSNGGAETEASSSQPQLTETQSTAARSSQLQPSIFSSVASPPSQTSYTPSEIGHMPPNAAPLPPLGTVPSAYIQPASAVPAQPFVRPPVSSILLPGPSSPPQCLKCGLLTILYPVKSTNKHGNSGRPYYKCVCGWWASFGDNIGNYPWNPPCECGLSSRRQRRNDGASYFYRCRMGTCMRTRTETLEQEREQMIRLEGGIVQGMAGLSL